MGLWLHFVNVLLIHHVYLQFNNHIIDVSVFPLIKMALALVINLHLAGINTGVVFPYLVSPLFFLDGKPNCHFLNSCFLLFPLISQYIIMKKKILWENTYHVKIVFWNEIRWRHLDWLPLGMCRLLSIIEEAMV